MIPMGSTTKIFTALQVMQYVDKGKIGLEDFASAWADPVMLKLKNLTVQKLWGPDAATVTIRHLLGMASGFGDYDDDMMRLRQMANKSLDIDPFDFLVDCARNKM